MPANALHLAAKTGEMDEAEKFMAELQEADEKARINEVDSTGWTPLHWAASRGREQIVQYLLENNADATIVTEDNWSPVHDAARAGSEKCLRLLKDAGANMTLKTANGSTALHYASQYDRFDVVRYLLNLDNTEGLVDVANAMGQTALHIAAKNGKEKTVEVLLEFNANTLQQDKIHHTAEMLATDNSFPAVATTLQEASIAQREQQVSRGELALKDAEEAEMMDDRARQIESLSTAETLSQLKRSK